MNSKTHFLELPKGYEKIDSLYEPFLLENINQDGITDVLIEDNRISFKTKYVGKPHMIKVSYFPNWEIRNGHGPYRVDPSFMLIIPLEVNVELNFKTSNLELVSRILFFLAISTSIFLNTLLKRRFNIV